MPESPPLPPPVRLVLLPLISHPVLESFVPSRASSSPSCPCITSLCSTDPRGRLVAAGVPLPRRLPRDYCSESSSARRRWACGWPSEMHRFRPPPIPRPFPLPYPSVDAEDSTHVGAAAARCCGCHCCCLLPSTLRGVHGPGSDGDCIGAAVGRPRPSSLRLDVCHCHCHYLCLCLSLDLSRRSPSCSSLLHGVHATDAQSCRSQCTLTERQSNQRDAAAYLIWRLYLLDFSPVVSVLLARPVSSEQGLPNQPLAKQTGRASRQQVLPRKKPASQLTHALPDTLPRLPSPTPTT